MNCYIFVFLCLLSLSILIYSTHTSIKNFRLISKTLTSLCFLLISLSAYFNNANNFNYFLLIFIGLIFSFLGDLFLGINNSNSISNNTLFLCALISFSITHIFYSLSFINLSKLFFRNFLFAIMLAFILISILKCTKKINFKNMFIPVCFYALIISFMVCTSLSLVNITYLNNIYLSLIISGTVIFLISDFILAFVLFYKDCSKVVSRLNLITYYVGQILISLSILYI